MDTLDTDTDPARRQRGPPGGDAELGVTALYGAHAVAMIRIALIMLGDRAAAEDVVQDAFFGLYRRWSRLADPANALTYVRSAVLNGCRTRCGGGRGATGGTAPPRGPGRTSARPRRWR